MDLSDNQLTASTSQGTRSPTEGHSILAKPSRPTTCLGMYRRWGRGRRQSMARSSIGVTSNPKERREEEACWGPGTGSGGRRRGEPVAVDSQPSPCSRRLLQVPVAVGLKDGTPRRGVEGLQNRPEAGRSGPSSARVRHLRPARGRSVPSPRQQTLPALRRLFGHHVRLLGLRRESAHLSRRLVGNRQPSALDCPDFSWARSRPGPRLLPTSSSRSSKETQSTPSR